jgi:hypothetical protein
MVKDRNFQLIKMFMQVRHGLKMVEGSGLNQLNYLFSIFLDNNQSIYIADSRNNRIVK